MSYASAYKNFMISQKAETKQGAQDTDAISLKFKQGSIFYEPQHGEAAGPKKAEYHAEEHNTKDPLVDHSKSKNSLFFQDFSVYPNSRKDTTLDNPVSYDHAPAASKNSIFDTPVSAGLSKNSIFSIDTTPASSLAVKTASLPVVITPIQSPTDGVTSASFTPRYQDVINQEKSFQLPFVPTKKNMLGEGRFGTVYRVSDGKHDFAVKKVSPDPEAQTNGLVEAFVLRKIQSWSSYERTKNIVRFYGVQVEEQGKGDSESCPSFMLVLEFCPCGALSEYALNYPSECGRRMWIKWCKQIAQAVAFLHRGCNDEKVIHGDLKPHNVLLNENLDAKLADFGNASFIENATVFTELSDGFGKGTTAYSAPELLNPPYSFTFSSDIYSLGASFYFLLTGREPFADIRNPSLQLWYIQKGFIDSGANPLSPTSGSSSDKQLMPTRSLQVVRRDVTAQKEPTSPTPSSDIPLLKFLNGEVLHSLSVHDSKASTLISGLIKSCTHKRAESRPSIDEVLYLLDQIDDSLIPGDGFSADNRMTTIKESVVEKVAGGRRVTLK
ncbi:hypothetical protein MP638_005686 [Amoeboaphelidium occidentale]|nr:hypothetical protein MP638_005686 [Amoeboaphelidium occidentale]